MLVVLSLATLILETFIHDLQKVYFPKTDLEPHGMQNNKQAMPSLKWLLFVDIFFQNTQNTEVEVVFIVLQWRKT